MGHQARNPSIAVKKRVNPQKAVMRCRRAKDRVRPAQVVVDFSKAFQKAWQRTGTDGDVCADLHIAWAQFAGHNTYTLFRVRVLNQQKILRQQFTEAAVDFADALSCDRARFQSTPITPLLDPPMRLRLQLQVTLTRVFA